MKRIRIPLQIIGRCQLAVCLENDEAKNIDEFAIFAPPNEIRSWSTIQYTAALFHGISFLQAFCSLLIVCACARARRCTQISLWPFNLFWKWPGSLPARATMDWLFIAHHIDDKHITVNYELRTYTISSNIVQFSRWNVSDSNSIASNNEYGM